MQKLHTSQRWNNLVSQISLNWSSNFVVQIPGVEIFRSAMMSILSQCVCVCIFFAVSALSSPLHSYIFQSLCRHSSCSSTAPLQLLPAANSSHPLLDLTSAAITSPNALPCTLVYPPLSIGETRILIDIVLCPLQCSKISSIVHWTTGPQMSFFVHCREWKTEGYTDQDPKRYPSLSRAMLINILLSIGIPDILLCPLDHLISFSVHWRDKDTATLADILLIHCNTQISFFVHQRDWDSEGYSLVSIAMLVILEDILLCPLEYGTQIFFCFHKRDQDTVGYPPVHSNSQSQPSLSFGILRYPSLFGGETRIVEDILPCSFQYSRISFSVHRNA